MYDPITYGARSNPDAIALVEGDERRTYAALDREVGALAGRLRALDVGPGDRLGLLAGPSAGFARLVHAARRVGAVLVAFDARGTDADVRKQYRAVDATALVVDGKRADIARSVVDDRDRTPIVSIDADDPRPLSALPVREGTPADLDLDDHQLVLFTSGTTGDPKAVALTVGNLLWSAIASAFRLGVHRGDRWLSPLPMHHMGGLAPVLRSALYGTTVIVTGGFHPPSVVETMRAREITGISVVPTMLDRLLDAGEFPESVRFVLTGGAPTPSELVERCERRSVPICPTYGTTETASQVATATPEEAFAHPESVGRPLAFTEVSVVGEGGDRLVGEPGEIVVDGPTVAPGYLDGADAAFGSRGFHTGDVGIVDEDGRLRVLGRLDDLIVTGGESVAPREVAEVLVDHPAVRDAAVIGLDDPEWGERVGALIVPEPDAALDADDIRAHCDEQLAGYKHPRTVCFADEFPRTASGTVDREAVRERLGEPDSDA